MAPAPANVKEIIISILDNPQRYAGMFKPPAKLMAYLQGKEEDAHKDFRFLKNSLTHQPENMHEIVETNFPRLIAEKKNVILVTFEAHKSFLGLGSSTLFFYVMVVPARFHAEGAFSNDQRGSFILLVYEVNFKWKDILDTVNYFLQLGKDQKPTRDFGSKLLDPLTVCSEKGAYFSYVDYYKATSNYDFVINIPNELRELIKKSS